MRFSNLYSSALKKINRKGADLDLQILLEHAFRLSRQKYWTSRQKEVKDLSALRKFYRYVERLKKNEPVAYIIKSKDFYTTSFFVNHNVLIPRPETELLVEQALKQIKAADRVLDIGAGSGNICISLALHSMAQITAVEISPAAIHILKKNIYRQRVFERIQIRRADLFPTFHTRFHMIVANPPYISAAEWQHLPENVKNFEPRQALAGGEKGSEVLEKIIRQAPAYLMSGGRLFLEIGYNQRGVVTALLRKNKFKNIRFFNDLNNIPRVVRARL